MNKELVRKFQDVLGDTQVLEAEPMRRHTTFRIGGPADLFLIPTTVQQVMDAAALCRESGIPWFVLGNGSNLLVGDEGFRGVILQIDRNLSRIEVDGRKIKAEAGVLLSKAAAEARDHALTGMEFASGIPGTVGGGAVMNAGAYGGEMKQILKQVTVLDENGNKRDLAAEELDLGYRHSIMQDNDWIVLSVIMELNPGEQGQIAARMNELKEQRVAKQPLEYPSAGSTFKRPEGYFAGKLIMDAGLRGYRVGDAQISEKHCGFVINRGNATAADVLRLIADVQSRVFEKFGVKLETEVKYLG